MASVKALKNKVDAVSFTPHDFIVGRVKAIKGNERETVYNTARALFNTDHMQFAMTVFDGHAWYMASRSDLFGDYPESTSPLSVALPGAAGHQGFGAYVIELNAASSAVIVTSEEGIKSFIGSPAMVDRFIEIEGAPARFNVSQGTIPWASFLEQERRDGTLLAKQSLLAGVCLIVMLGASILFLSSDKVRRQTAIERELEKQNIAMQGVADQINRLSGSFDSLLLDHEKLISSVSAIKGARIRSFRFDGGKESWVVEVPLNTSKDAISKFGVDVSSTIDSVTSKILLKKG